jgi:hypothetical protein
MDSCICPPIKQGHFKCFDKHALTANFNQRPVKYLIALR